LDDADGCRFGERMSIIEQFPHHVAWTIDRHGIRGVVTCHAPEGAFCRLVCDQDCEEWAPDHEHELHDVGYCNVVEFITNGDSIEDAYIGPANETLCSGFIVPQWQGDWYGWSYADGREVLRASMAALSAAEQEAVNVVAS
jgi:hypothetical protein